MKVFNFILKPFKLSVQSRLISSPKKPNKEPPKNFKEFYNFVIESQKNLPRALKLNFQEIFKDWKEKLSVDMFIDHQSYKYIANFRKMADSEFDRWSVSTDSDIQGLSTASLIRHQEKKTAIFSGFLNTTVPKVGDVVRSGLVSFRSPHRIILGSVRSISFYPYNCFIIKYRGDGRTYHLNIQTNAYVDLHWDDLYSTPLYTHGGPYWQIAKIPFHKFFLSAKGRIQDVQMAFNSRFVRHISISLMDKNHGTFNFEVDYMAISKEFLANDIFSYEMYNMPSRDHRFK